MPNVPRPDAPDVYLPRQIEQEDREIAAKINGLLSFGRGVHTERTGNLDGQWLRVPFIFTANAPHKVFHGLGRIPVWFEYMTIERAASVYAVNMGSWTDRVMYVASDSKDYEALLRVY